MYVPVSLWPEIKAELFRISSDAKIGDGANLINFVNTEIDEDSFDKYMHYIACDEESAEAEIIYRGNGNKSIGYFVEPTIIVTSNPKFKSMQEEIFGPVLTVFIYEDSKLEETITLCNETSPSGLTGAVFSRDRVAAASMCEQLRYAAGNFYINDKPTGAIVGLQPFGGSRASGTNDKAGGEFNLIRWISPGRIKETFQPASEYRYNYMME